MYDNLKCKFVELSSIGTVDYRLLKLAVPSCAVFPASWL
jgi:hypothetical protein